ncbi:MAG TPA: hypothetical protein VNB22_08975 [Pyrinomonadaceae bacterium]|nr:hypothetical protein [Pyrinomonadaceae bacterium]
MKNTAAALLVLTLSGAYYLLCCQEMKAATAQAEHCPLSKSVRTEHCNFSKNKTSETPSQTAASINLFECCNLKFNFFVAKLEKNEFPQQTPSALANNFFNFLQSVKLENNAGFTGFSYRVPVFGSRDLHVRNCVFRI